MVDSANSLVLIVSQAQANQTQEYMARAGQPEQGLLGLDFSAQRDEDLQAVHEVDALDAEDSLLYARPLVGYAREDWGLTSDTSKPWSSTSPTMPAVGLQHFAHAQQ